ncbi:unnamed protein product [Nesidiocoris tenuis]|uniref:Uncharacterized protein n=1 Tax=Nesidiocoris tenuis TaxID=355587 RepID=A0A6H5HVG0_9HEMI|nr:unnamed protein product [Nesidiocoris tenuis]
MSETRYANFGTPQNRITSSCRNIKNIHAFCKINKTPTEIIGMIRTLYPIKKSSIRKKPPET